MQCGGLAEEEEEEGSQSDQQAHPGFGQVAQQRQTAAVLMERGRRNGPVGWVWSVALLKSGELNTRTNLKSDFTH